MWPTLGSFIIQLPCLFCWNGPDGDVKLFPQKPILLQGHERSITQIKYNREGDLLFSVAKDTVSITADEAIPWANVLRDYINWWMIHCDLILKVVNVWYSVNGERLGTYNGHTGAVWCVDCDCILPKNYTCDTYLQKKVWILLHKMHNINRGATWHFFNTFPLRGHEKCLDRVGRQQLSALGLWDW